MYGGDPAVVPVVVVRSTSRAMPKSITRGPSGASSTLPGLKSRCTTPARWIAASAVIVATASRCRAAPVRTPSAAITCWSVGPSTYSLTMYGGSWSRATSRMAAVQNSATCRAAVISRLNADESFTRRRERRTLIATFRPVWATPW